MGSKTLITADLDYVVGHLRYGHLELELDDKELEEFKGLSEEGQLEMVGYDGKLIIDSFEVDDYDSPTAFTIHEKEDK